MAISRLKGRKISNDCEPQIPEFPTYYRGRNTCHNFHFNQPAPAKIKGLDVVEKIYEPIMTAKELIESYEELIKMWKNVLTENSKSEKERIQIVVSNIEVLLKTKRG